MTKTITLTVSFASVKEAEEAQATASTMRDNFESGSVQYKLRDSIYTKLYSVYEDMWEARHFGYECPSCGTSHGMERDCRMEDVDDCVPGYMRSDRHQL